MNLLALIYGVSIDTIKRMYDEGLLVFSVVEYANIAEHLHEQRKVYKKAMDAAYDTLFHFNCTMSKVYKAKKMFEDYEYLLEKKRTESIANGS